MLLPFKNCPMKIRISLVELTKQFSLVKAIQLFLGGLLFEISKEFSFLETRPFQHGCSEVIVARSALFR